MWKDPHSKRSKLIENIRKKCPVMNFKIQTGLISKPHDFFENKPNRLDEKWIDERIDNFTMFVSRMLFKNNLILDKEV